MLQSIIPGGLHGLVSVLQWVVAALVLAVVLYRGPVEPNRRQAFWLGCAWVVLVTVEYWGLGPWSAMTIEDEADFSIPLFSFLANQYDGGQLVHGWGMDQDVYSITDVGMAYVSLERLLFKAFPIWLAVGVHKLLVAGVGFAGAYVLARRGGGATRFASLALAAWYTLAMNQSLSITLAHGLGYAVTALAVYLLVFRTDKPNYFLGALGISVVHAVSCSIGHSPLAVGAAVILAWALVRPNNARRFMFALCLLVSLTALNWAEVLNALILNGPESYRGTAYTLALDVNPVVFMLSIFANMPEAYFIFALSIVVLITRADRRWVSGLLQPLIIGALSFGLITANWEQTPLPMLKAFDFSNFKFSLTATVVLVGAWACQRTDEFAQRFEFQRWITPAATFAISLGMMAEAKAFNSAQWIGRGSVALFTDYKNLAAAEWAPKDRMFRVASVPYRLSPAMTSRYGLESVDANLNVVPRSYGLLFQKGFPGGTVIPHYYVTSHRAADFLCCKTYEFAPLANLNLLRLTNTEFVISVLPLSGDALTQVSGLSRPFSLPRRDAPFGDRLGSLLRANLAGSHVYVYRISDPIPRAYSARSIIELDMSSPTSPLYEKVYAIARDRGAAIPSIPGAGWSTDISAAQRVSAEKASDGYDLEIEADGPTLIVVNTVWSPYWTAKLGDQTLPVASANAIHTAVWVPAGGGTVRLRYHRPTVLERLTHQAG